MKMTIKYKIRVPINHLKGYSRACGVLISDMRAQAELGLESLARFASLGTWEKLLSLSFHAEIFEVLRDPCDISENSFCVD